MFLFHIIPIDNAKALWQDTYTMNKLTHDQRVRVVNCLVEGCSIRATVRMTGIAKKTVMRLLAEIGEVFRILSGSRASESFLPPHSA